MNRVIGFYSSIYEKCSDRVNIHINIRDYAKKMADMQVVMKPIIEYVLDH